MSSPPPPTRRCSVVLDQRTDAILDGLAATTGRSRSAIVRDGVDLILERASQRARDSIAAIVAARTET